MLQGCLVQLVRLSPRGRKLLKGAVQYGSYYPDVAVYIYVHLNEMI